MGLSEQNLLHFETVQWYHDLVTGHGPGVPESIFRRIRRCLVCRRRVHHLQEAVTGAGGETDVSRSDMKRDVIDTLSLHFGCLEEQVTCSRVKPFLPGLLMPSVQIRIPTPITVHLDHCPECAEDLEALRGLGLSAEQLERLEQLYEQENLVAGAARPSKQDPRLCRRARARIAAFVQGSLDDIDGEILNHLCTCPRCRSRVSRSRQKLISRRAAPPNLFDGVPDVGLGRPKAHGQTSLPVLPGAAAACGADTPIAQLFDYAVPYGRTARSQERAGDSHVRACRPCLRKVQVLDETIYGIAERTDSGVTTVYSTAENAREIAESFADPYPEYPIHVQVIRGAPERDAGFGWSPANVKAALNRTACNLQVRFLLKTAVAVAAVLVLASLFRGTAHTSGVTLAQVFRAFEKAENVHISRFYLPAGQLTQEFWISRTSNVLLVTVGQESTLYDLGAKEAHVRRLSEGSAGTRDMTDRVYAKARSQVDAYLGLTLNDVPSTAKWTRVSDEDAEGLDTYELTFGEQSPSGAIVSWKWEIRIDPLTRRPREIQMLHRASAGNPWRYVRKTEIRYPTDGEMNAALATEHVRSEGGT
jgi:hypothetical protein